MPIKNALIKNVLLRRKAPLTLGERPKRPLLKRKAPLTLQEAAEAAVEEKGPLTLRERPKSREETPKEGDGIREDSLATALQQHTPRRTKRKCC